MSRKVFHSSALHKAALKKSSLYKFEDLFAGACQSGCVILQMNTRTKAEGAEYICTYVHHVALGAV